MAYASLGKSKILTEIMGFKRGAGGHSTVLLTQNSLGFQKQNQPAEVQGNRSGNPVVNSFSCSGAT